MKALIVNPFWDTMGGGERYTSAFTSLLLASNWQVDIAWPQPLTTAIHDRFGIDLSPVRFVSPKTSYLLESANYHLVFWLTNGSLPTSLASKTIIHCQFPFRNISGKSPLNFLKSRRYTFVCNSRFTKSFIDPEFSVESLVIYPPVDTTYFHTGKKTNTVLYVGRFSHLTQAKNPHLLIEAFKDFHASHPTWQLVLAGGAGVGTADSLTQLSKQAAGFPITIIPNPTRPELKKLFAKATFFWSAAGFGVDARSEPLKVEHFGITLVESMAAGCIPVVSNLGGHQEIVVHGESGFLCSTPAELVTTTHNLLGQPRRLTQIAHQSQIQSRLFDTSEFNTHFLKLL